MSELPIADTPDAMTPAWFTEALRRSGRLRDGEVTAVDLRPIGTGQMSDSFRITLRYAGGEGPATMIAKLPAADETSRATAVSLHNYENEVLFYQQLAPNLPIHTPTVYYTDIEPGTPHFVLLLEDMAPARAGDQLRGCSPDEARVAVGELVGLHAPRWGDPALASLDWLAGDRVERRDFMLVLLPQLWEGFGQRYGDVYGHEVALAAGALFDELPGYLGADTEPWTIVHGDYRLDNLLFDPTPGHQPVTVVDWQTCAVGPGLNDVAYFIGAGLLPGDRAANEEELVRSYHDGLLASGVQDYDWERCWRDYRRGTWSGVIMAVAASMLVERTDRGDEMFMTMAARHARHALDLDAVDLLR
jgi:hypothetical protein